ncbi:MAG: hypothetical protein K2Q18_12550 [Bdellovibrionales bacterium]|nr:hypothetical protein [Bdellovibrionales bacterium]
MKNFLLLGLTFLTMSAAVAGPFDRPQDPRRPGPGGGRDTAFELTMCLKNLDNAQRTTSDALREASNARTDLDQCRRSQVDPREVMNLRRDNQRLLDDVAALRRENQDLRIQLDQSRPQRLQFFSYAACTSNGTPDLSRVGAGVGMLQIEAEQAALQNTQASKSCSFGVKVVKTEEIRSNDPLNYCSASCSSNGRPDLSRSAGERGRNQTEASYLALKRVQELYSCSFGAQVVSCQ